MIKKNQNYFIENIYFRFNIPKNLKGKICYP